MSRRLPQWLQPLALEAADMLPEEFSRFLPPDSGGRPAAVLILLGHGPAGPDVLLIERATTMRSHAGQPAFPGGATDPGDAGPVGTAMREAAEEVGLDRSSVQVVACLPALWLPPSGFVVTPVVAWWHDPHPLGSLDPAEVATAVRVPIRALADPANRMQVAHPSRYVGPAFEAGGMLVWGFTAGLLDRLIARSGWERPWDTTRIRQLPPEAIELATRTAPADLPGDVPA